MTSPRHPIEGVYEARNALEQAVSVQARLDIAHQDWAAYGSALMGVLSGLGHLTDMLVEQVDQVDRDYLYSQALRDHPQEALDRAVEHLNSLSRVLATAVSDARGYWSEAQHVHEDTSHQPHEPE